MTNTTITEAIDAGKRLAEPIPNSQRYTNSPFSAKFASDCAECDAPIFRGVSVSFLDNKIVHHECAVRVVEGRLTGDRMARARREAVDKDVPLTLEQEEARRTDAGVYATGYEPMPMDF